VLLPPTENDAMNLDERFTVAVEHPDLPFIWPEARILAGLARYADSPPSRKLVTDADLISGILVGAAEETLRWLNELLCKEEARRICLVLVVFPAGPTREEHLRALYLLQASHARSEKMLEVRLLPVADQFPGDCKRATLPPTVVQAHNTQTGRTVMNIGSVGDAGCDPVCLGSLGFVLQPDDALRDAWRRWFQFVFSSAAPLTKHTLQIPYLVPARGEPEAARQWQAFESACQEQVLPGLQATTIDPATGEVTTGADGRRREDGARPTRTGFPPALRERMARYRGRSNAHQTLDHSR
jgi:hypothetical protein